MVEILEQNIKEYKVNEEQLHTFFLNQLVTLGFITDASEWEVDGRIGESGDSSFYLLRIKEKPLP